ncbi:Hypoxia-inducible factor 1-alpha [Nymphon striatum]|nr:Hypoxia-inducible factor 1-alpha [Nymphon striatum]
MHGWLHKMFSICTIVILLCQTTGTAIGSRAEMLKKPEPPPVPAEYDNRYDPPPLIYPPSHRPVVLPPGVHIRTSHETTSQTYSKNHKHTTSSKPTTTAKHYKTRRTTVAIAKDTWNMTDSRGKKCIMFKGQFTFNVPYVTKDYVYHQANLTIPRDAKLTNNSRCKTDTGNQLVELEFDGNVAAFEFVKKNNKTSLNNLSMNYTIDPVHFPNAAHPGKRKYIEAKNIDAFSTPEDKSFNCPKPTKITMSGGVSMVANNVQLDSFRDIASSIFSKGVNCISNPSSSTSLPVAVGSLVAGSVPAVTCLAKFIKDRKSKKPKKPSEKRKKKSRDAARFRRSKESELFQEIVELLPLPRNTLSNLDKGASMRIFINYIHLRQFVVNMNYLDASSLTHKDVITNKLYGEAIDGFVLILSVSGNIIYLSESVNKYLGIAQVDLLGQSLFDFSHPCDHEDIRGMLAVDHSSITSKHRLLRMKCSVSKRETKVRPPSYKVIRCVGRVVNEKKSSKELQDNDNENVNCHSLKFVSVASPIPHPSNIETFLGQTTFLSRHNTAMKFTYIDSRISDLLHYEEKELLNKSLYLFIHPLDIQQITDSFKECKLIFYTKCFVFTEFQME